MDDGLLSDDVGFREKDEEDEKGEYSGMSWDEMVDARQSVEDLIGLDAYYEIEEQTVEGKNWGKR